MDDRLVLSVAPRLRNVTDRDFPMTAATQKIVTSLFPDVSRYNAPRAPFCFPRVARRAVTSFAREQTDTQSFSPDLRTSEFPATGGNTAGKFCDSVACHAVRVATT